MSPEAREAVQRAIDELGYVPNRAARALVTQRTDSVALVVSESEERVFGEPFFAGIIRGISSVLAETPLQLWLAMAQSPAERERVEHYLTGQHVDGVLLLSLHGADPLPALLDAARAADRARRPAGPDAQQIAATRSTLSSTRTTPAAPGRRCEHLLGAGRRRIATIAGPQDMGVGVARLAGYRRGAAAWPGCRSTSARSRTATSPRPAAASGDARAARPPPGPGRGVRRLRPDGGRRDAGAARDGRRVPDDVAVVGFEDSPIARQTDPPLTTVHQPVEAMGREMARLLVARIGGGAAESVVLDTHLVRAPPRRRRPLRSARYATTRRSR